MKRFLPPYLLLLLMIAASLFTAFAPWMGPLPLVWRVPGIVLMLVGAALSARGSLTFASLDTNIKTFNDPDKLVDTGVFRFSRNPMYLGFLVLLIGVALVLGSLTAWLAPMAFLVAADRWYIPYEERRMNAIFGADYQRYQGNVRRWIGRR